MHKPQIHQLKPQSFPDYEEIQLSNGARIAIIREPEWKVFRLEACFLAGRPFEHKKGVAKATAELLQEGSREYSSLQIAEHFEQNGASFKSKSGIDTAHVLMHGPSDKFELLYATFYELMTAPAFPQHELDKYKRRQKERLLADLSINEVVSYRNLTEGLFGKDHPYGYNSSPQTYDAVLQTDLIRHHKATYAPDNVLFLLSGGVDDQMIEVLCKKLEHWKTKSASATPPRKDTPARQGTEIIENEGSFQASVKMGKLMFPYGHDDYAYVQIANTLLGGYFGSRLMKRIRQEEGLSYNIYSTVESMMFDGYWMLGTETSVANVENVLELIREEMKRLAGERIKTREIKMMRNYLIGNSLQFFEGAFNKSDFLRHQLFEVGNRRTYKPMMQAIQEMDAEKIRAIAEKYFQLEDLLMVVVK